REQHVVAALQSGAWSDISNDALREHANSCPTCADAVVVMQFLRHEAALVGGEVALPSASLVWWKAQLAAQRRAVARTTRPLDLAWSLGLTAVFVTLLWRVLVLFQGRSSSSDLQPSFLHGAGWLGGLAGEVALFAGSATLVCLLLGGL